MCTLLLPPGDNPNAVNKYTCIYSIPVLHSPPVLLSTKKTLRHWDGSGIKFRWGRDFFLPSRPALRSLRYVAGLFAGRKVAAAWCLLPILIYR